MGLPILVWGSRTERQRERGAGEEERAEKAEVTRGVTMKTKMEQSSRVKLEDR